MTADTPENSIEVATGVTPNAPEVSTYLHYYFWRLLMINNQVQNISHSTTTLYLIICVPTILFYKQYFRAIFFNNDLRHFYQLLKINMLKMLKFLSCIVPQYYCG